MGAGRITAIFRKITSLMASWLTSFRLQGKIIDVLTILMVRQASLSISFNSEIPMRKLFALACLAAIATCGQATAQTPVTFPDLSNGGDFTINDGEIATLTGNANIADDAASVLTINGTLDAVTNAVEVQFGGVNGGDANQDVAINVGTTGSILLNRAWFAAGWPGNTTDPLIAGTTLDFAADDTSGGSISFDGTNFGLRSNGGNGFSASGTGGGGGQDIASLYEYLYTGGLLTYNGTNTTAFGDAFTLTVDDNGGNQISQLTAMTTGGANVPEPSSIALIVLGAFGLATRRRKNS